MFALSFFDKSKFYLFKEAIFYAYSRLKNVLLKPNKIFGLLLR